MTSRCTEKTFRRTFDATSSTKKSLPPDTKRRRRLSGSHTGYPPSSVNRVNVLVRKEYVRMPRPARPSKPASHRPSGDHELMMKGPARPLNGGRTSGVWAAQGRLGSNTYALSGWPLPAVMVTAMREPSGDHTGKLASGTAVSWERSLPSGRIFHNS